MTIAEKITRAKADYDEVYEGGKTKAFSEVEPINAELEQILYGKDTGGRGFYDEFWDEYQQNGTRTNYDEGFAGVGWTKKTFRPKYDIIPKEAYMAFRDNAAEIDLVDFCDKNGIVIDFSKITKAQYIFYNASFTHLGVLDFSTLIDASLMTGAFNFCRAKTVDLLKLSATKGAYTATFSDWHYLENITIEGSINCGGANFSRATKLTKASITSIINALSTTTSGLAITFSETAVNKAFETAEGANDGSTSAEWNALIAPKSNWTISLV